MMAFLKKCLKWVALKVCGKYALYRIYQLSVVDSNIDQKCEDEPGLVVFRQLRDVKELKASQHVCLCETVPYAGDEAYGFGAWHNQGLVAVCWFWAGRRYQKRGFWPLKPDEAKLVEIVTADEFRGRGIAPRLIQFATREMQRLGYKQLYARIWHSNRDSIGAFERAKWIYFAFVAEFFPFGVQKPVRITRTIRRGSHENKS